MKKKILKIELIKDGHKLEFSSVMDFRGDGRYWFDLPTIDFDAWNAVQIKITVEEVEIT